MLEAYLTISVCALIFVCLLFKGAGRRDEIPKCLGHCPHTAQGMAENDCESCNYINECCN